MLGTFRIIIPFLIAAALAGCEDDAARSPQGEKDSAATTGRPPETPDVAQQKPAGEIQMLPFDKKSIEGKFPFRGNINSGARWRDANGENVLIISAATLEGNNDARVQEIYGYHYAVTPDTTRTLWTIRDFAENMCDQGAGLVSDVVVRDLDGDGVAENAFVYNVEGACDVSPSTYKLMLHSGERKYAVRGSNRVIVSLEPGTPAEGGAKRFDPAFDSAPPEFRRFADSLWSAVVK